VPEELEDLFADLRADAIRGIRPPGADQVRRTVRRRRTTTAAVAGVLLVVLGGTVALLGFPSRPTPPAGRDPLTRTELDRLTGLADRAVTASNPGPAVFTRGGPVVGVFRATEQIFLGEINLQVACAGTGSVTLLVRGTPSSESNTTERTEVARLTVQCSAEPLPAGTTFVLGQFIDITVELVDADSARGRAGFAYRATSDTGEPATRDGPNNPTAALRLPEELPPGSGWGGGLEVTDRRIPADWDPLDGDFRLALACAGTGSLRVTVRQARSATDPEGTVTGTKTFDATCGYPPERQDFVIGRIRNRQVNLSWTYESGSPAPARIGYQFLPR
jgi:hypothetical protein